MNPDRRRDAPSLHCREAGAGTEVLLLHCSAGTGAQWGALAAQLEPGFRVRVPDLHGCGASAPHPGGALGVAGHALALARLLGDAPRPVHLVGHSFGGAVALRLARMLGQRVRSLTVIEPVAFQYLRPGDGADAATYTVIEDLARTMRARVAAGDDAGAMRRFVDFWNGAGSFDALDAGRREALAAQARRVLEDFDAIGRESPQPQVLTSIRAPTLVLQGGRSPLVASLVSRRVAAAIPNACRVRIRDAGHMAPITHAEVVNLLIATHLDLAETRAQRRVAVPSTTEPAALAA